MREFFRGWKRKVGCVTLLMACVFGGLWLRGLSTFDRVTIANRDSYTVFHFSDRHFYSLGVCCLHGQILDRVNPPRTEWNSWGNQYTPEQLRKMLEAREQALTSPEAKSQNFWSKNLCGTLFEGGDTYLQVVIPYWSLILPLTLLSAYLLLSMPRLGKRPKSSCDAQNKREIPDRR